MVLGVKREGSINIDLSKAPKIKSDSDFTESDATAVQVKIVAKLGSKKGVMVIEGKYGKHVLGTATIDYASTHARQPRSRPREAGAL